MLRVTKLQIEKDHGQTQKLSTFTNIFHRSHRFHVCKLKIPRFRAKKSKLQIRNGVEMKYVIDTSSFHARIEYRCRGSSKRISNPSFDPLYCVMSCRLSASNLLNARDTKSSGEKIRRRGTSKCRIAFKKRARTRGSDGLKYQRSPAARLRTIRDSSPEVTNSNVKSSLNIYRVRRRLFTYADNKRSLSRWIFYICINIYVYIFEISRIFNEKFDFSVAKVVNLLLRYVLMVI